MSNPTLAATQIKTASVVFQGMLNGTLTTIPAGGTVTWSVSPAGAIAFGTPSAQSVPATGGNVAGTTVNLTATEPVSGFSVTQAVDIKALQILISQGTITLA